MIILAKKVKKKNDIGKQPSQHRLSDNFGRVAQKLRISVTDRCNLRCIYCMPSDNAIWVEKNNILSYEEITRLTAVFVSLGIDKIRITGGEPTVRPRLADLIQSISKIRSQIH